MTFHRHQKQITDLNVCIDNTLIERVESFNYLGIMLNETLSWKSHIEIVGKKNFKSYRNTISTKKIFFPKMYYLHSIILLSFHILTIDYCCRGLTVINSKCCKKRFMTTSINYIAHTAPLFIQHGVLRVTDMYKLKLLKFFYKLSYNLLPTYFDNYSETLEQNPIRDLRQNLIHGPLIKRVYAECSPLFQLVKLTNTLKKDKNDTILEKNYR